MADMNTRFEVGDFVMKGRDPKQWVGPYEVIAVVDVPKDEIEYNEVDHSGGVGHPQWLNLGAGNACVSGLLCHKSLFDWRGKAVHYGKNIPFDKWPTSDDYLALPTYQIGEEEYNEMLEILPPMMWHTSGGINRFMVSEAITGDIHEMYMLCVIGDVEHCYRKYVNARDRTTWPQMEQLSKAIDTRE